MSRKNTLSKQENDIEAAQKAKEKIEYSRVKKSLPKIPKFKSTLLLLGFVYVAIAKIATIYLITFVFKALIDQDSKKFLVWFLINLTVGASFLIIQYVSKYFLEKESAILKTKLRRYIFKAYSSEEGQAKISKAPGTFKSITIGNVNDYVDNTIKGKYSLMENVLKLLLSGILIFYISWIMGLISLGLCFLVIILMAVISPFLSGGQKKLTKSTNALNDEISSNLSSHSVFYLNNSGSKIVGFLKEKFTWIEKKTVSFYTKAILSQTPSIIMGIFTEVGLIILACILVISGHISKETLVAISLLSGVFTASVFETAMGMQNVAQFSKLFYYFVPSIEDPIELEYVGDIDSIKVENYNISFEGKELFKENISVQLQKGKKYVIVGDSGSGKSTFVNSILGRQKSFGGTIKIGGINSEKVSAKTIINNVGILNSEPHIFNATLLENITLFDNSINSQDIKNIMDAINFEDLELDKKIDLSSISEGQKQKINFVRIVLKNPGWIISDEGFSNVDNTSRQNIINYLSNIYEGGLINITHHLSKKEEVIYDSKISF